MFVSCLFIFDEGQHPEPTVGCLSKSMSLPGCKYLDVFYIDFWGVATCGSCYLGLLMEDQCHAQAGSFECDTAKDFY